MKTSRPVSRRRQAFLSRLTLAGITGSRCMLVATAISLLGFSGCITHPLGLRDPVPPTCKPGAELLPPTNIACCPAPFYGYEPTCWRPWPGGWIGCPPCPEEILEEEVQRLPRTEEEMPMDAQEAPPTSPDTAPVPEPTLDPTPVPEVDPVPDPNPLPDVDPLPDSPTLPPLPGDGSAAGLDRRGFAVEAPPSSPRFAEPEEERTPTTTPGISPRNTSPWSPRIVESPTVNDAAPRRAPEPTDTRQKESISRTPSIDQPTFQRPDAGASESPRKPDESPEKDVAQRPRLAPKPTDDGPSAPQKPVPTLIVKQEPLPRFGVEREAPAPKPKTIVGKPSQDQPKLIIKDEPAPSHAPIVLRDPIAKETFVLKSNPAPKPDLFIQQEPAPESSSDARFAPHPGSMRIRLHTPPDQDLVTRRDGHDAGTEKAAIEPLPAVRDEHSALNSRAPRPEAPAETRIASAEPSPSDILRPRIPTVNEERFEQPTTEPMKHALIRSVSEFPLPGAPSDSEHNQAVEQPGTDASETPDVDTDPVFRHVRIAAEPQFSEASLSGSSPAESLDPGPLDPVVRRIRVAPEPDLGLRQESTPAGISIETEDNETEDKGFFSGVVERWKLHEEKLRRHREQRARRQAERDPPAGSGVIRVIYDSPED